MPKRAGDLVDPVDGKSSLPASPVVETPVAELEEELTPEEELAPEEELPDVVVLEEDELVLVPPVVSPVQGHILETPASFASQLTFVAGLPIPEQFVSV